MIDRTIPAVSSAFRANEYEAAMAHSFCYLASYNHAAVPARVQTSLSRAWDYDALQTVQRVPAGRPGYSVAIWNRTGLARVIVAIEGMTSRQQIYGELGGFNSSSVTGCEGHVHTSFETHANTIIAELGANAEVQAALLVPGCQFWLSGFSLGAAIAEVMACKYYVTTPNFGVKVYKFASPMVGSSRWANSLQMPPERLNIYCMWDPIHCLPFACVRPFAAGGFTLYQAFTFMAPGRPIARYDMRFDDIPLGNFGGGRMSGEEAYLLFIDAIQHTRRALDENNWWWWHDQDQYRAMFCGLVSRAESRWHYQYRYLEFDDDNQWGQMYRPGAGLQTAMKVLADPAPAAVEVPIGVQEPGLSSGGDDWGGGYTQEQQGRVVSRTQSFANPAWRPRRSSRSPLSQR